MENQEVIAKCLRAPLSELIELCKFDFIDGRIESVFFDDISLIDIRGEQEFRFFSFNNATPINQIIERQFDDWKFADLRSLLYYILKSEIEKRLIREGSIIAFGSKITFGFPIFWVDYLDEDGNGIYVKKWRALDIFSSFIPLPPEVSILLVREKNNKK